MNLQISAEGKMPLILEALRQPGKPGFDVAVYHRQTVTVPAAYPRGVALPKPPEVDIDVWVSKELIHSVLPNPEKALEQVMAWIDMRCK
jgi:hypothetical protein